MLDSYPTIPDRPCIICIILRSRARKTSSFFFLSDGGFASDTWNTTVELTHNRSGNWLNSLRCVSRRHPFRPSLAWPAQHCRDPRSERKRSLWSSWHARLFRNSRSVPVLQRKQFRTICQSNCLQTYLELFLGDFLCEIADVQDFHFAHRALIRLFLRISPVHDNITAPDLKENKWLDVLIALISNEIITLIRPVPSLRFASEAALCDSYSRKQNPRFFFLSSGEL